VPDGKGILASVLDHSNITELTKNFADRPIRFTVQFVYGNETIGRRGKNKIYAFFDGSLLT
jgi:hypothetical protein